MYSANSLSDRQAVLHEKNRIRARRKRIFFTFLFLLITVGFFVAIRKPFLRISSIEVSGNTLTSPRDIKSFVDTKVTGYKFFLIPNNSIIFLEKKDLQSEILKKFPRLSSATISGTRDVKIVITEPVFDSMYCEILDGVPNKCALLHTGGKVGSVAPVYSYPPFFTFYKESALGQVGEVAISIDEIDRIRLLRQEIESYGIRVIGFVYGAEYDEILLDTGSNYSDLPRIRLTSGVNRQDIVKTLGSAIKDDNVKKLLLDELPNLEYIDLRFSGQVVYRKKD